MIYVIATITAHPGKGDVIAGAAAACIEATLKEAGCLYYDLYRKTGHPDQLVFVEGWESRDHLQAHFGTAHIKAFGAAIADAVLTSKVEIVHPEKVEIV